MSHRPRTRLPPALGYRLLVLIGLCAVWTAAVPSAAAPDAVGDAVAVDDDGCERDCPEDDENGECPPGCDACPCCPAAASPAASTERLLASSVRGPGATRPNLESGKAEEGALSRLFRPPIAAIS